MKYVDEYRNRLISGKLIKKINLLGKNCKRQISLMEVCGTHTVAIFRYGIRKILPKNIRLISGPGCPVCVTSEEDIDKAIAICAVPAVIVTTFGDMLKVPGSKASLLKMKSEGADVRGIYSILDALEIAKENPNKKIVHLSVGFETTAPTIAAALVRAEKEKLKNFYVLPAHKLVPPALDALFASARCAINGLVLPGHVSSIIGAKSYEFIPDKYGLSCVVAGFEPVDILQAIYMLMEMICSSKPALKIQYTRCVSNRGNITAKKLLNHVFEVCDAQWRGLGIIKNSGLRLRSKFKRFDISNIVALKTGRQKKSPCRCGEVLQGLISPLECPLFAKECSPLKPIGPCMVSSEGTCSAYYRYGRKDG